jgi:hypothetical protein
MTGWTGLSGDLIWWRLDCGKVGKPAARRAFSVQYHPQASPGPSDSHNLFHRFITMLAAQAERPGGAAVAHAD